MASKYGATFDAAINSALRAVSAASGISPSAMVNDIWDYINGSSFGSLATGRDIDALCLGPSSIGYDATTSAGLTFGFSAGVVKVGNGVKAIGAGTILLTASSTNYIELDGSGGGSVTTNTSGWTTGKARLYIAVTGVSTISTVTNAKVILEAATPAAIVGAMLSAPAATKEINLSLGTITATASFDLTAPNVAATFLQAAFNNGSNTLSDNTNYWSFSLKNKSTDGTGTLDLLATTAVNSTQTTGGSSNTAHAPRLFTNHPSNSLATVANTGLLLTATATGAPTALVGATVRLDFSYAT